MGLVDFSICSCNFTYKKKKKKLYCYLVPFCICLLFDLGAYPFTLLISIGFISLENGHACCSICILKPSISLAQVLYISLISINNGFFLFFIFLLLVLRPPFIL
jgi:hypothetical protein